MLRSRAQIFSGMPNPTWLLSKRQETTLYELLDAEPNQMTPVLASEKRFGLGYRGLIVRRIKSDDGAWDKAVAARRVPFPNAFRLGIKTAKKDSAAEWLVKTANRQGADLADEVRDVVSRGVVLVPATRGLATRVPTSIANVSRKPRVAVDVPYNAARKYTRRGGCAVPTISTRTQASSTTLPM